METIQHITLVAEALERIRKRQSDLMVKFHPIEERVMGHTIPNIFDEEIFPRTEREQRVRELIYFGIEELGEALAEVHNSLEQKTELIDALHFFTEACIFIGVNPSVNSYHCGKVNVTDIIKDFTFATHSLKAKPWKQTPKDTNVEVLCSRMNHAYQTFFTYLLNSMDIHEIEALYMGKAVVNDERMKEKY